MKSSWSRTVITERLGLLGAAAQSNQQALVRDQCLQLPHRPRPLKVTTLPNSGVFNQSLIFLMCQLHAELRFQPGGIFTWRPQQHLIQAPFRECVSSRYSYYVKFLIFY